MLPGSCAHDPFQTHQWICNLHFVTAKDCEPLIDLSILIELQYPALMFSCGEKELTELSGKSFRKPFFDPASLLRIRISGPRPRPDHMDHNGVFGRMNPEFRFPSIEDIARHLLKEIVVAHLDVTKGRVEHGNNGHGYTAASITALQTDTAPWTSRKDDLDFAA